MSSDPPHSRGREPPPYDLPTTGAKVLPYRDARDGSVGVLVSAPSNNPRDRLPPIQTLVADLDTRQSLPSISSVTGSVPGSMPTSIAGSVASLESPTTSLAPSEAFSITPTAGPTASDHWPSLNPLAAYYTPGHVESSSPRQMDVDSSSTTTNTDTRAASVSLDDPDVRLAAEALGDLRADVVSSSGRQQLRAPAQSSEPLFSLLTTSHPLLAKTIEGTTSAYMHGKNVSPRFKSGAEYVEGYLAPISNTIGSVSRVTGVEGSVRWFLGRQRRTQQNASRNDSNDSGRLSFYKRRKVDQRRGGSSSSNLSNMSNVNSTGGEQASTSGSQRYPSELTEEQRRLSMSTVETLPAYDDVRSPAYTEWVEGKPQAAASGDASPTDKNPDEWQSRLSMSTSGLSISMSEESLRSLKYCLNWLKWANGHVDKVVACVKTDIEHYDTVERERALAHATISIQGAQEVSAADDDIARKALEERIATQRGDLLVTLRSAVETVSKYAGGALPENARILVRKHLTSLPQRFRLASQATSRDEGNTNSGTSTPDKDVRDGAQRVLVLAKEGLDMMSQVSGVLDGTIASAEEWCERLGKKRLQSQQDSEREPRHGLRPPQHPNSPTPRPTPRVEFDGDVIMG